MTDHIITLCYEEHHNINFQNVYDEGFFAYINNVYKTQGICGNDRGKSIYILDLTKVHTIITIIIIIFRLHIKITRQFKGMVNFSKRVIQRKF